jgi:cardiolipin synthase (CMP-forming)
MPLKYLPNTLTLLRCFFTIPFLIFFYQKNYVFALYILLFSGFTDGLDGWLARRFHWESRLGLVLDPIADKLLILSGFVALACLGQISWLLVELVFFRDLSILLGVLAWLRIMKRDLKFQPTWLSKMNTVIEFLLIAYCLLEQSLYLFYSPLKYSLIGLVALTTTSSYIQYVWVWAKRASLNQSEMK